MHAHTRTHTQYTQGEIREVYPPGERREVGMAVHPNPRYRTDDAAGVGKPSSAGASADLHLLFRRL